MTTLTVVLVAGIGGLGVLILACGLTGRVVLPTAATPTAASRRVHSPWERPLTRTGIAVATGLVVLLLTRWPVAAVAAAAGGWSLPAGIRASGRHRRELDLVEAIATWAEQLRDTITAANGLEHAIGATAALAPAPILPQVQRLAARVEYERLDDGLRRFADEVDHPLADFVVAALITASQHQARELGALLGHLSECARAEATMRTRVWVGRARTRSAVRIIVAVVVLFVAGLLVLDREYLSPYDTAMGQVVLAGIVCLFAGSLLAMERMGRVALPDRFVGRREAVVS